MLIHPSDCQKYAYIRKIHRQRSSKFLASLIGIQKGFNASLASDHNVMFPLLLFQLHVIDFLWMEEIPGTL